MSIVVQTAVGAVALKEMYDQFEKGIDISQGPWVKKSYLLEQWAAGDAVCNTLMGSITATTVGGQILRVNPQPCPDSPNLYCLDARAEGQAEVDAMDGQRPRFNQCVIRCHYGVPQKYDIANPDPLNSFEQDDASGNPTGQAFTYAVESIDFDTEVIKLPGSGYTFVTPPALAVDVPVSRSIGVANLVFVRKMVPYLPTNLILGKLNKLNLNKFLGQDKGQIKFLRARTRTERFVGGQKTQEIELHFKWREFTHNAVHRPDKRVFDLIQDSTGNTMYDYADLTPLLQ